MGIPPKYPKMAVFMANAMKNRWICTANREVCLEPTTCCAPTKMCCNGCGSGGPAQGLLDYDIYIACGV